MADIDPGGWFRCGYLPLGGRYFLKVVWVYRLVPGARTIIAFDLFVQFSYLYASISWIMLSNIIAKPLKKAK